jgi:negative regulator of flagellin synthesis FlgM
MKIDNDKQVVLLNNLTKPSSLKGGSDAQGSSQKVAGTGDKVELSGWKDQVNSLKERVKALPDVDENKVASVKQAIDSGTYNAKGVLVARSMLKSQLLDETL